MSYLSHVSVKFLDRGFLLPDNIGDALVLLPLVLLFFDVLVLLHIDNALIELLLGLSFLLPLDILLEHLNLDSHVV